MKFQDFSSIITEVTLATEAAGKALGFKYYTDGGSVQSCSSYFSLVRENDESGEQQSLSVRISDHSPRNRVSEIDLNIGLFSDHGADKIEATRIWERDVITVDADGEPESWDTVACDEDDEDAELTGFEVSQDEINRIANVIVAKAVSQDWE